MVFSFRTFYKGPYRYVSVLFIVAVGIGGYFYPVIGLAVPALMLLALAINFRSRRLFCSSVCPNGRALSVVAVPASRGRRLPAFLVEPGMRRILCGFMLFCMVNLLVRYGGGGIAAVGRVFWSVYLIAVGISVVVGMAFKPRSWCAFCPMGTLQDTVAGATRDTTVRSD
jgi:polyferredoxin